MMRWTPRETDRQSCQECGSHVTVEFRRGYGDQDDVSHRCWKCDSSERLSKGSAAGKDVVLADPLDDPTRFPLALSDLPSNVRAAVEARTVATDGGEDA